MSSERNIDFFSGLILILSIIALVLLLIGPFAGFYYTGYGNRYSCFSCEYYTDVDLISQIIILILLILQIVISLNELLPNRFISKDMTLIGLILAISTFSFALIGLISFGVYYSEFDWWADLGFYGTLVGGLLNAILFFLKKRNQ